LSLIGISDFNPISAQPYAHHPLASTSNRPPIALAAGCVLSAAPLAVLLTALACYLARRWHLPHMMMIPQRSVRCLSWFATRSAAAAQRPSATCCQNAAASDALRPAAASNSAHVSPAVRRSSPSAAANSSATNSRSSSAMLIVARGSPGYRRSRSTTNALHSPRNR